MIYDENNEKSPMPESKSSQAKREEEEKEEEDIEDGPKPQAKLSFACSLHKS